MSRISVFILPAVISGIILFGFYRQVNLFDAFLAGAREGAKSAFSVLPALVGLVTSVSMLRASGALSFLARVLSPVTGVLGMPPEVLPLALLRPVSGSGSLAILQDILTATGPDSMAGRIASVMMGSSETTFYALAVYFGAVGIKNSRYTLPAALLCDLCGALCACYFCQLFFT